MTRVAIVTGAGGGIGAATAMRLAHRGHAVAVMDSNYDAAETSAQAISDLGLSARALRVDVTDPDSVAAGVDEVAQTLGPPTILVNNAGIIRDNSLRNMSLEDWTSVLNVHLTGAYLLSKSCQSHMVAEGFGRIVNLSSTSATGNRGQANYSAAKAGLQGFTKTLALELGKFGITVNAVAPGFIETEMTKATALRIGMDYSELVAVAASNTAVKRTGTPEDTAHAIDFFCSEESSFVTGQVLYVAGTPHV